MLILITVVTIVLYIILFGFTIHNLNPILEPKMKILFFIIGLVCMLITTFIVFSISASGVQYENPKMVGNIRLIMLAVFIPVNGIITMPYIANIASKIYTDNITQEKAKSRFIMIAIIFIVILVFECSYFRKTQIGIINLINHM